MPPLEISAIASLYLGALSAYHMVSGALSFFAPGLALRLYRGAYGCDPVERRHLLIILRPWGALAVFAGLAGFAALAVPACRHWIEAALIVLLVMRVAYRLALGKELWEISGIPPRRNLLSVGFLLLGTGVLAADLTRHYLGAGGR